jgi:hypothetical protein
MSAAYLYLNAVLYLGFAAWCTFQPSATSAKLGYHTLSSGGRSEYLVIYGGLQLGLAAMFWLMARDPTLNHTGVLLAVLLYLPIVVYRAITVARQWPVTSVTIATGGLEVALLVAGSWIYAKAV